MPKARKISQAGPQQWRRQAGRLITKSEFFTRLSRAQTRFGVRRSFRAFLALLLTIGFSVPGESEPNLYRALSSEMAGLPGTVIRLQPMRLAVPRANTYHVLYRSTGFNGEPIAVSGVVIIPTGPAPRGGRPVVAWGHPTTGLVPNCAPSLALSLFLQIQGLQDMVRRGYIVAATDYPGLGTPGPHPYLVGPSEGRAVLDAVRAARNLAGKSASNRVALWGHSQGGQAVLFAGLIGHEYAPELQIVGVAAAAPATDLQKLLENDIGTPGGRNFVAMTLWSWSRVFDMPVSDIIDPAATTTVNSIANTCIESPFDMLSRYLDGKALQKHFLSVRELTDLKPWQSILASNTVGILPSTVPVFLAQGAADRTIAPEVTREYMERLCSHGSAVRMLMLPKTGHLLAAHRSAASAMEWIAARFEGAPAPTDCAQSDGVTGQKDSILNSL